MRNRYQQLGESCRKGICNCYDNTHQGTQDPKEFVEFVPLPPGYEGRGK